MQPQKRRRVWRHDRERRSKHIPSAVNDRHSIHRCGMIGWKNRTSRAKHSIHEKEWNDERDKKNGDFSFAAKPLPKINRTDSENGCNERKRKRFHNRKRDVAL